MRRVLVVILLLCSINFIYAQEVYWNRSHLFSFNTGVYSMFRLKIQAEVDARNPISSKMLSSSLPLHFKYEYFLGRQFSAGAEFSYVQGSAAFSKDDYDYTAGHDTIYDYKVKSANPAVAVFVGLHSNNRRVSPFLSLGYQYNFIRDKFIETNDPLPDKDDYSTFDISPAKTFLIQLGLRVMVKKNLGVTVYASYFPSIIAIGVCYKLRKE